MPEERELIMVQDDRGNTFQMTPQDAKLAGYRRVGESAEEATAAEAQAAAPSAGRKSVANKKQTTAAPSGPTPAGESGIDVVETASDGEQQSPQGGTDQGDGA